MKKNSEIKKYFKPVFFTLLGIAAVYFCFGSVNVGAPASGSDDLMYLSRILNQQNELMVSEDGTINVSEFAVLGYRDIPDDVSIYTLKYDAEGETVSVVPVILKRDGDGVEWEEFKDSTYSEQFEKLPGTIREILTNVEKHNAVVKELEEKANAVVEKYFSGWYTYKNVDFNYQIDFPINWIVQDYQDSASGLATAVAFDPVKALDTQEYGYLDQAPGAMWIFVTDAIPSGPFEQLEVGAVTASYQQIVEDESGPNPWWFNKIDNRYYLPLPGRAEFLTIETNYSNEADTELLENLKKMLASFKFL